MTVMALYKSGALFLVAASIVYLLLSLYWLRPYRKMYLLMIFVPLVVALGYWLMSMSVGIVEVDGTTVNITRYTDWMITTPILLYMLMYAMYQDRDKRHKRFLIITAMDILMLSTGLLAELTEGNVRTLLFSVSSLLYLGMIYLIVEGMLDLNLERSVPRLRRTALAMAWIILILWSIYPAIWIVSGTGLGLLSEIQTEGAYLVMDLLTKLGFSGFLLYFLAMEMQTETQYDS